MSKILVNHISESLKKEIDQEIEIILEETRKSVKQ